MKVLGRIQAILFAYVFLLGVGTPAAFSQQSSCIVTTNLDSGPGSLREALNCANADPDFSTITFNIEGSGLITIYSDLPGITTPVLIDGTSQPGYSPTQNPLIHLRSDDSNGGWSCLTLFGGSEGSEIKGLYISNFISYGIWVRANNMTIDQNVINYFRHTDANANTCVGFYNAGDGSKVFGNIFGSDFTGADLTYNHADHNDVGVYVFSINGPSIQNIQIGGTQPGQANKFAFLEDGVTLYGDGLVSNIQISGNDYISMFDMPYYFYPGTNLTRPLPTITSCALYLVQGTSQPLDQIELYASNENNLNATYLATVTADNTGQWSFDLSTLSKPLPVSLYIEAEAIDPQGNSSQMSVSCQLTCTITSQTLAPKTMCTQNEILLGPDNLLNGLIAYYPFNGSADDASGNGEDGTLVGNLHSVADRFGNGNSAYSFDGSDYIQTSLTSLGGSALTISYWFNGGNTQYAVMQQKGSDFIGSGPNSLQILSNNGTPETGLTEGNTLQLYDGAWHHVALTWKQNTANGFTTYLDGVLVAQKNSSTSPLPSIPAFVMLGKGADNNYFIGDLDDVAFFNRALSAQEIQALAQDYTWTGNALQNSTSTNIGPLAVATPEVSTSYTFSSSCINGAAIQYSLALTVTAATTTHLPDVPTCAVTEVMLPATPSLTNGLLAYFPFNGDAADKSGNNATGTISGSLTPATDRFGNTSGAFHFDGTSYVQTDITSLAGSALTFSYWYQGTSSINFAVGQYNEGDLVMSTWHGVHMLTNDGSTDESKAMSPGIPSIMYDGNWHHFVVTWQQNQPNGFRSYMDGKLMDQRTSGNTPISDLSVPLMFGYCFWGDHLKGNMDDIAIYKRALTEQEVRSLFNTFTWTQNGNSSQAGSFLLVPPVAANVYAVSPSNSTYYVPNALLNCVQYDMKLSPCLDTDLSYYVLKSKPEASVVELPSNQLKFYFKERYLEGTFNIQVYDYAKNVFSGLDIPAKKYGENYVSISLPPAFPTNKVYQLELTGTNLEKYYMRFKYSPTNQ